MGCKDVVYGVAIKIVLVGDFDIKFFLMVMKNQNKIVIIIFKYFYMYTEF